MKTKQNQIKGREEDLILINRDNNQSRKRRFGDLLDGDG